MFIENVLLFPLVPLEGHRKHCLSMQPSAQSLYFHWAISRKTRKYRKGTSIRQAPVFRHLRALRKNPWKFIIWMNEL